MSKKICPACGSDKIKEICIKKRIHESFGEGIQISLKEYKCELCGSSGDFFSENDLTIQDALSSLKKEAVVNILNNFLAHKISLSSMERALELPQRTLTKWKSGYSKPSSSGIALLKFLGLFPWLLEVAENKYDSVTSQKIHMNSAFQKMLKCIDYNKNDFAEAGIVATAKSTFYYLHYERSVNDLEANDDVSCMSNKPQVTVSFGSNP